MPYNDKEEQRQWFRDRRKLIRKVIEEAKAVPCADCGIQYPFYVMQFDHVRGLKLINLGSATARVKSLIALHEEIKKCDVVCANCHAERTYLRRVPLNGGQTGLNPVASNKTGVRFVYPPPDLPM